MSSDDSNPIGYLKEIAAAFKLGSVDRLGKVGREGDDTVDGLRYANCAADFVGDLSRRWRRLARRWGCLRMANCLAAK